MNRKLSKHALIFVLQLILSLAIAPATKKEFASIKLLMDAITRKMPTEDKLAQALEIATIKNIKAMVYASTIVFKCQDGNNHIRKTYYFPFTGSTSAGKSFTVMHFFAHAIKHSQVYQKLHNTETDLLTYARARYNCFNKFINESENLITVLSNVHDHNQIELILKAITNKFSTKPLVNFVFLLEGGQLCY